MLFAYLGLKYFDKPLHKILIFTAALVFSYFLTIFANASRIFASIVVRNQTARFFPYKQPLIHESDLFFNLDNNGTLRAHSLINNPKKKISI